MFRSRPPSFRRILLLRILLLSMPILLIGQYVTVRKARTSLLETARENLASSAVRKAINLSRDIQSLQSHLHTVSQTALMQSGSVSESTAFLQDLAAQLPQPVDCLQLTDETAGKIAFSTCENVVLTSPLNLPWIFQTATPSLSQEPNFYLVYAGTNPQETADESSARSLADMAVTGTQEIQNYTPLDVIIATPIYTPEGRLRYTLTLRATLSQPENSSPGSLVGDMVVINQDGLILTHPDHQQIGKRITDVGDQARLLSILENVQAGRSDTLHLFEFLPVGQEWLAGYTGVDIPIRPGETQRWAVLAVTPLEHALQGLKDIQNGLIVLTLGLLAANSLLALFVARSLSLPIEQLSRYAQQIQDLSHLKEPPKNFRVAELQHLSLVFTGMMKRLEERARDLRHAWQDAQVANQLKSEFLANTSHELRTPLNAIIGCIRLVRDECCDNREEEMEFLERADKAAIHLLRIINDILDIAKIESGKMSLKPEVSDLRQIIQEVVDLQSLQIQQKNLELVQSELSTPVWVLADRAKLKQVLLNILYNAQKFTEEGRITIDIQIHLEGSTDTCQPDYGSRISWDIPEPRALVAISDTGIGVDPQQQHRLFRPFVMIDGSTTRRFEGTGLGLSISKNFMNLMGGSIHLYSDGIGKGTTVVLLLPLSGAPETLGARRIEDNYSTAVSF